MHASSSFVTLEVTPGLVRGTFPTKAGELVTLDQIMASFDSIIDAKASSASSASSSSRVVGRRAVFLPRRLHGFLDAVRVAFDEHFPLVLRPQHFWVLIAQAVAQHVNLNAEALRSRWVDHHEGKKKLIVLRNDFVLGGKNNDWAGVVCGKPDSFLEQIKCNLVDGAAADVIPSEFSDTTDVEKVAMGITVMDTLQNYFEYRVLTMCGFPSITMEGTEADWRWLRDAAERLLSNRCLSSFAERWARVLLPLLEKFVEEYRKGVGKEGTSAAAAGDERFWNSILKRGAVGGSGGYSYISGWINIFFPIVNTGSGGGSGGGGSFNPCCKPYTVIVAEGVDVRGTNISYFPNGMSRAPVIWEYYERTIDLDFHSGFLCAMQDPITGAMRPRLEWYITTAKPSPSPSPPPSSPYEAYQQLRPRRTEAEIKAAEAEAEERAIAKFASLVSYL